MRVNINRLADFGGGGGGGDIFCSSENYQRNTRKCENVLQRIVH